MNYFKLLVIAFFLSHAVFAQTVKVIDSETNEPIPSATIISKNAKLFSVATAEGEFDLSKFKSIKELVIRSLGYKVLITSYQSLNRAPYLVALDPSNMELEEVIISGNRWKQNSTEVPYRVSRISKKDVALSNPQTAADLLGISGKVFVQKSQQGGGSPMIRGFATKRLLYSIDGVRMNTAIFRGGNLQNVISLDPFAMENTEVLFGPASVIYGSDAIGGVMSFKTLSPNFSLNDSINIHGNAAARYSSANNEQTGHVDLNLGWKKWALLTSISSFDYDHLRQGRHGSDDYLRTFHVERIDSTDRVVDNEDHLLQIPTGYEQINLMQKARFKPSEAWELQYGFHYSETSDYGRFDQHQRLRNGAPRYGRWDYGPQEWMMNNLSVLHRNDHALFNEAKLTLAIQSFEESRISRDLNQTNESNQIEKVDAFSINLDFKKFINPDNQLFYGIEGVINDVTSKGFDRNIISGLEMPINSRYPNSSWSSYAIYANHQYQATEQLTLAAGIRLSHYGLNADFDTSLFALPFNRAELDHEALSGSIGLTYRPGKSWVFKLNGTRAFRAPNVDDIGKIFDSEPGAVVVPNPDLDAEIAYNLEFGLAKVFGDFMKIDLTAFYTRLEDALVRRNFNLNNQDSIIFEGQLSRVQAIQNAAFAEVYGLQLGLEVKLGSGFSFSSDFNYQRGEEELDNGEKSRSRHAAPMFGISRISFQKQKLHWEVSVNYQGKRDHDDLPESEKRKTEFYALDEQGRPYAPAWYTLNIKTMYALTDRMKLSVGMENITDQRYRPYSSGISGAGRNFVLSLRTQF